MLIKVIHSALPGTPLAVAAIKEVDDKNFISERTVMDNIMNILFHVEQKERTKVQILSNYL